MDFLSALLAGPRWLLACLLLIGTAVALVGLSRIQVDSDPRSMLNAEDVASGPLQRLEADFGSDDLECVVVLEGPDFISPEGVVVVRGLVNQLSKLDGVDRVTSMLDVRGPRKALRGRYLLPLIPPTPDASPSWFANAREGAADHPLLGRLLSTDRKTSLVIVRFSGGRADEAVVRNRVGELQKLVDEATTGTKYAGGLTGLPVLRLDMIGSLMRDQVKFNATAMSAAAVLCLLLFRSVFSTLMVMLASLTGVLWTLGAMGWMGIPINMITSVIAPLVLVIGVSDAIHLHLEMRRAKHAGASRLQAAQTGIRNVGPACGLTSFTTFVGFASLYLASLDVIRTFAIWSAIGCVLNFLAVILVLPLLTTVFPEKALTGEFRLVARTASSLARLLNRITNWRRTVAIGSLAVTAALILLSMQLRPENKLTETIPTRQPAYRALRKCDATFGGALVARVLVEWNAESSDDLIPVLAEIHEAIDRQPNVYQPTSLLSLLASLPGDSSDLRTRIGQLRRIPASVAQQYVSESGQSAVVDSLIPDVGSRKLQPQFEALRLDLEDIAQRHPGFSIALTGGSVLSFRNLRLVVQDLWRSLSAAALVIIVVLSLVFRSLKLGIISAIPNVFPLASAGAALVLMGRPLEVSSVVVFSMCLGIATDDTIHFLARYRKEQSDGASPADAVRESINVVGEAILVTTVLLTIGFGSFLFSRIPALQNVGQLACISLGAALIGDLVILPSLLLTLYAPNQLDSETHSPTGKNQ